VNFNRTVDILNAVIASGYKHFIHTSSVTVVIDDLNYNYNLINEETALTNLVCEDVVGRGSEQYLLGGLSTIA
jgi:nucleoside-diphosphate-sugar epimerase